MPRPPQVLRITARLPKTPDQAFVITFTMTNVAGGEGTVTQIELVPGPSPTQAARMAVIQFAAQLKLETSLALIPVRKSKRAWENFRKYAATLRDAGRCTIRYQHYRGLPSELLIDAVDIHTRSTS